MTHEAWVANEPGVANETRMSDEAATPAMSLRGRRARHQRARHAGQS
jgi:hypothetical protein